MRKVRGSGKNDSISEAVFGIGQSAPSEQKSGEIAEGLPFMPIVNWFGNGVLWPYSGI